jgi:1-acyl-sn-glycerol-3-phosphate acyltransferase
VHESSHRPPADRSLRAPLARRALGLAGWRLVVDAPLPARCVIVFYPHTSNWDFCIGLVAKWALGLHVRFVGKDSLFVGPLGPLFRYWGGIPANRRERTGLTERLAAMVAEQPELRLAIAPEGTRSRAAAWRSGFYRIALAAQVPVMLAFIDYPRRAIGIGARVDLCGDSAVDMARIAAFYADKVGLRRERQ